LLFEESILKNGFAPVISIPTHVRAGCKSSCIDNILANDLSNSILSECLSDKIGDHSPIFQLTNIEFGAEPKDDRHPKLYEFSNENLKKFSAALENELSSHTFSDFTSAYSSAIDSACKLDKPKMTRRNPINNPWITSSIISAVDRKHELKDKWVKSITRSNPNGDQDLYQTFSLYRKVLKPIINSAKNSYKCNQIIENKHNRKKTWQIINELYGKCKKIVKPSFMIDNKKVIDSRVITNEFNKYFNSIASN
jgi:hypothetical protein